MKQKFIRLTNSSGKERTVSVDDIAFVHAVGSGIGLGYYSHCCECIISKPQIKKRERLFRSLFLLRLRIVAVLTEFNTFLE